MPSRCINHYARISVRMSMGGEGYATNGTPSDCVVLGLYALMPACDLVISGINFVPNLGEDLTYSGTVSAAMEGVICGKPAIAISVAADERPDFTPAARFLVRLARKVLRYGLPPDVLLNVNVPNLPEEALTGVAITHQGKRRYEGRVERRVDPRGRPYYWLGGEIAQRSPAKTVMEKRCGKAIYRDSTASRPHKLRRFPGVAAMDAGE